LIILSHMISTQTMINLLRFLVGFSVLFYASYTDLKIRKASNYLWLIMGSTGGVLLIIEYILFGGFGNQIMYLVFIPIIIIIMYVFFQLRLLFGGADAKAMMAIAILTPFTPTLFSLPLYTSVLPFSWVIFSNAIILFLLIPLGLFVYNLSKKNVRFPHCFLGYQMELEDAREKFVWPLEHLKHDKLKISYVPHSIDPNDQFDAFEEKGINKIWVTPKIPFMIPLLAGFICAFSLGDILLFITHLISGI